MMDGIGRIMLQKKTVQRCQLLGPLEYVLADKLKLACQWPLISEIMPQIKLRNCRKKRTEDFSSWWTRPLALEAILRRL